jgi:hypothetical protein
VRAILSRPDGSTLTFEGDDAETLGIVVATYEREKLKPTSVASVLSNEVSSDPWGNFIDRIRDKPDQLRVLRLVKDQGPHSLNQLADLLGAENTLELGGLLGAIRRTTLRAGFETTDDVLLKKGRFYMPGPALAANELPSVVSTTTRWDHINEEDDT